MTRRVRWRAALLAGVLIATLVGSVAVLSARTGTVLRASGQARANRVLAVHGDAHDIRWKAQLRIEENGSVGGQGSLRVARTRARANVIGTFDGAQLEIQLLDDQGRELARANGALSDDGLLGTFITAAGDTGTWSAPSRPRHEHDD